MKRACRLAFVLPVLLAVVTGCQPEPEPEPGPTPTPGNTRSFTPQTYCLTLPSTLKVEGRIHMPPLPVPIPTSSTGLITLENPRPDVLGRVVPWLNERVSGN